ncbi:18S PRE-RIBOSOMAL ASSEMBLY PROTEIN GAR2-LIKE PROTEIN [Salix purpurea]|uniref:18S PRE-RIBOSOMAL ASSEMBLY PROTEIN GAR2-LIKE PROTEIN n=1 Tax=Salix purpurea TaxID=77065 RepID=A0A9Q0UAF3_SALPP|nr:18S PRE-RIBOSOMAL ASSEMBLY PROTEIN GAR2-LIKE PROTEIN [Salix purpurea]
MSHEPEYNDNALDSIGLKSGNGFVKEIESGKLSYLKGMEGDADRLTNIAPVPSHSSPKMEPFKESVFYMDKSVMERELPELIVCYKENTYHVKDICVDDGAPLQDKFLFDTDANEKNVSERDMNNEMVKEMSDPGMLIPDMMKSSSEKQNVDLYLPVPDALVSSEKKGLKYDLFPDCDPKHLMLKEKVDYVTKKDADDASKEILSLRDLFLMSELGTKFTQSNASNHSMDKAEQQPLLCPRENAILETDSASEESENCSEKTISVSSALVSAAEELDNGCEAATLAIPTQDPAYQEADHGHKEAVLVSPTHISAAEDSKETKLASHALDSISEEVTRRIVDDLPYDSKTETQSISLDDVSSTPTGRAREPQNNGARIFSRFEDPNAESLSGGQLQYADGESSFSSSGPLFGLISHSGRVAYSGSISLRSDSSTTSTRSFAFPILQSEWNSSPVRMAKADRRHFQKPRKWMQGLLCCGF